MVYDLGFLASLVILLAVGIGAAVFIHMIITSRDENLTCKKCGAKKE